MAQVVNVSVGGMFLNSAEVLQFGEELTIELELPRARAPLRLPAIVRWTLAEGFGVQFGLLGARDTHALVELTRG